MHQRLAGGHAAALDMRLANADQHPRQVRQRRQVARDAGRAALWHDRQCVVLQQGQQGIDDFIAHTRQAMRQAGRLQQQHQAHDRRRQRRADTDTVRKNQIALHLRQVIVADARRPERTKP